MGFSAIQISPVVKNIENRTIYGSAFHGYWPTDWYALNEHFGSAQDLRDLAKALHDRDMLLMVDVVINDMAVAIDKDMTKDTVIDYRQFNPFDDKKYYHPWCNLSDWNDNTLAQNCWLGSSVVALPDLDTESVTVQNMVNSWIKELVSNYSIDGLRIDAAKHVSDPFLKSFIEAAGVFTLGEVYTVDLGIQCRYSKFVEGLPNFATYYPLIDAFAGANMIPLGTMVERVRTECRDVSLLGSFSENHDLPRFPSINPDLTVSPHSL
jgi:alpha-amylase